MPGAQSPLHHWNTALSVHRELALRFEEVRSKAKEESSVADSRGGSSEAAAIPWELDRAIEKLEAAKLRAPDPDALTLDIATVHLAAGRTREAAAALEALEPGAAPWAGRWLNLRGITRAEAEDWTGARDDFEGAARVEDTRSAATFNLALAHWRAGERDDAKEASRRFLALEPRGPWSDAARAMLE
jgi:tetratricopeptide (TPR) repeat protein